MEKTRSNFILLVILIGTNLLWAFGYFMQYRDLARAESLVREQDVNVKVVSFSRQFVDDVLRAQTEVDFETRLKLENAVREMKDKEVLAQWGKFINSQSEAEAQMEVKNLLALLLSRIVVAR